MICLDLSKEWTDIARTFWDQAGVAEKIELRLGDALASLQQLASAPLFDLVHIDAEKTLYNDFYEAVLPRVRQGGLIIFDNMLRAGRVVESDLDGRTAAVKKMNSKLASDSRVETVLITMGDGIQMRRKK